MAMLLSTFTQTGRAQPPPAAWERCRIEVTGTISALWLTALTRACDELAARQDLDTDAHVRVTPGPNDGLILQASLRDGRSAVRHVEARDGLALTMAALLVLPTPVNITPAPAPPAPPANEVSSTTASAAGNAKAAPQPAPATASLDRAVTEPVAPQSATGFRLHLGLSAAVIGHVSGAPTYVAAGFAVRISLRLGMLLVDASPRWEAAQASLRMRLPDFEMHSFGMAAFLGLRVWEGNDGAIETGVGTLVLAETQSYRQFGVELVGTLISSQPALFARLLWGNPPNLRWTIGLEANVAPRRFSHEAHVRDMLPPLPVFGVGLSFGGQWESS
jgi:hypothetical protein